jgi:hypothetical protein
MAVDITRSRRGAPICAVLGRWERRSAKMGKSHPEKKPPHETTWNVMWNKNSNNRESLVS